MLSKFSEGFLVESLDVIQCSRLLNAFRLELSKEQQGCAEESQSCVYGILLHPHLLPSSLASYVFNIHPRWSQLCANLI